MVYAIWIHFNFKLIPPSLCKFEKIQVLHFMNSDIENLLHQFVCMKTLNGNIYFLPNIYCKLLNCKWIFFTNPTLIFISLLLNFFGILFGFIELYCIALNNPRVNQSLMACVYASITSPQVWNWR